MRLLVCLSYLRPWLFLDPVFLLPLQRFSSILFPLRQQHQLHRLQKRLPN